MSVLELTPRPDDAVVDVVVTGAGAVVSLFRTDSRGAVSLVRGSPFPTQGGALTVIDGEAPFGLVTYATDELGTDAASTVLDVPVPWLTHPFGPFLSTPVQLVDDAGWSWPGRNYPFDVIGRRTPVVTWYPRSSRAGTVTLAFEDRAQRTAISDALGTGAPMLLRVPVDQPMFDSGYVSIVDARLTALRPGSAAGSYELDYVRCAAPAGAPLVSPGWSWADVPTEFPTWADLRARCARWSDVVTFDPTPPAAARFGG